LISGEGTVVTFDFVESDMSARIKVIGVGGGGNNAINNMIASGLQGVEFIAANTDAQALEMSRADVKVQLGKGLTKGLGAGANPEIGREAAEESVSEIRDVLEDSDMVFVTAGMGGGTGTGAAPVIAEISKELGALTVAVVTKPFMYEGKKRAKNAEEGLSRLTKVVDTIITIPNDKLRVIAEPGTPIITLYKKVDEVLYSAVRGISDLIIKPGHINVDFADVKTVMQEKGLALMGTGAASGPDRAEEAVRMAIANPLLEDITINGARGVLINITGHPESLTFEEFEVASTMIHKEAHEDANIFLGQAFDETIGDELRITVIATGIGNELPEHETVITSLETAKIRKRLAVAGGDVKRDVYVEESFSESVSGSSQVIPDSVDEGSGFGDDPVLEIPTFLRKKAD
jgi:cell division protein FtsZ